MEPQEKIKFQEMKSQEMVQPQEEMKPQGPVRPQEAGGVQEIGSEQPVLPTKKESGGVKFLRVVIWGIVAVVLSLGAAFLASSRKSMAFVDGTQQALESWGKICLGVGIGLGIGNLVWGAVRWGLRWRREHWKTGQVVGKLVGGGIWRLLVFVPLVLGTLLILAPPLRSLIAQRTQAEEVRSLDAGAKIEEDYRSGELTADEYVNYLIKAAYAPSELPADYQSKETMMVPDLLGLVDKHFDELNEETIKEAVGTAMLAKIDFGTDASGNVAQGTGGLWAQKAYAQTKNVKTLNKAKLSERGRFVIFYTDTGADAITEREAEELGGMLEEIIDGYENVLNQPYVYELYTMSNAKTKRMAEVLKANGIAENITDTAMAVYVANPYAEDNGILASYAGRRFTETWTDILMKLGGLLGVETAEFYNTVPAYPFVNILPANVKNTGLNLVVAHELGHHFSSLYCYRNSGAACRDNDFVDETLPNWAAVNVIPADEQAAGNTLEEHYEAYVERGTCYPIDEVLPEPGREHGCHKSGALAGYLAFAFMENYTQVIPNGVEEVFAALQSNEALMKLYDVAGKENFREVMVRLGERNLTGEGYGGRKIFQTKKMPPGEEIPCNDACEATYYIAPASLRYFYFPTGEYEDVDLKFEAGDKQAMSVLGKQGGKWSVIKQASSELEYWIGPEETYETIAVVVINYDVDMGSNIGLSVRAKDMAEILEDSKGPLTEMGSNCVGVNFDNILDFPAQLVQILSRLDSEGDYSETIADLKAQGAAGKAQLAYHYAMVCANDLKPGLEFQEVKEKLKQQVGPNIEMANLQEGKDTLSVIVAYDVLTSEGRVYLLGQYEGEVQLLTARLLEKAQ